MSRISKPTGEDTARHYEAAHRRLVELVRPLSEDVLATPVPSTPGWDVHDVIAHLAAVTTDALSGRLTGLPTDEFTSEQVSTRKATTVDELVAEWAGNVPAMVDGARAGLVPPNLAVDAVTHEQDIRGAIGAGRVGDREALRFSLDLYAFGLTRRMLAAPIPALRLQSTDSDFDVVTGEGEPQARVQATEFELFRTLSGRRSRDAVVTMDWDGDASAYLPWLNVFGALPEHEVVD